MLGNLSGWHMVILFAIILLLFGAPKLPGLARSVGQSLRILKTEVRTPDGNDSSASEEGVSDTEVASSQK